MQKRYIWLAGSFPKLTVVQGNGYRTRRTKYAFDDERDELIIFGYGTPLFFLANRGLFRKLQSGAYTLSDEGERQFRILLAKQEGGKINEQVEKVKAKRILK